MVSALPVHSFPERRQAGMLMVVPKHPRRAPRNSILRYFLAGYLALIAIPFAVATILYVRSVSQIREQIMNANLTRLQASRDLLDKRLGEVELIAQQIRLDPLILKYKHATDAFAKDTFSLTLEVRDRLYDYGIANRFISRYFVIFSESGVALGPRLTYRLPALRALQLNIPGMSRDEWYETFAGGGHYGAYLPATDIATHEGAARVVIYVDSIGHSLDRPANVVVLVDDREIRRFLSQMDLAGGVAYIEDAHGRLITSTGPIVGQPIAVRPGRRRPAQADTVWEGRVDGQRLLVSYTRSARANWNLVAVQPQRAVLREVVHARNVGLVSIVLSLVAGVFLAYRLASQNTAPILQLFDEPSEPGELTFGFSQIPTSVQQRVADLIESREQLTEELESEQALLRKLLLDRLLAGEITEDEEADNILAHVGLDRGAGPYVVAIVHIVATRDGDIQFHMLGKRRLVLRRLATELAIGPARVQDRFNGDLVLVLTAHEDLQGLFSTIVETSRDYLGFSVVVAVGTPYSDIADLYHSMEEARLALARAHHQSSATVLWYSQEGSKAASYYYPHDVEARLLSLLRTGNTAKTVALLDEVLERNDECADAASGRLLLYDLWATLAKFRSELGAGADGDSSASPVDLELQRIAVEPDARLPLLFDRLRSAYERGCTLAEIHRASRSRKLIQAIESHIEEHFTEPDLGIPSIAEAFAISETYLSQAFKEHTGETVYQRIENHRMRHARELVARTALPIRVVAERTGYNSSNTFCKAFKRAVGMSATSFRKDARLRAG